MAIAGLLHRTAIDARSIELVVMGTVIADPDTSNVARESALAAGVPSSCPAYTTTAACISANLAVREAAHAIAAGEIDVAVAGGTETLSDIPIRVSYPIRKRLIAGQKAKGVGEWLRLLKGLRFKDLAPVLPALTDFSTGLTMGQNAERLAKRLGISRADQDEYAMKSHRNAARATEEGLLASQIVPARVPPRFELIAADNGIRGDSTLEKLAGLRPAFDRRFGTITAGNSSYLTDGASAVLLAGEAGVRKLGLRPSAMVVSEALTAMDPLEELLLGPAFAIPVALRRAGLDLGQIDVLELHEAFAGQMLAVLQLMQKDGHAVDRERLNAWGGSLSVGHPFGATGGRLVATCCRRLEHEDGRYGLLAACASGALGYAMVLERVG
jgi:acetyl-CoA acyltransferase